MNNLAMLSSSSRIWVYQASRNLSTKEETYLEEKLDAFTADWSSHGSKLLVIAEIKHHRFVVIGVDESQAPASGCSIDKSVHFMTEIGQELGIDFLDRNLVYMAADELKTVEIKHIKNAVTSQIINPETIVFDNTVSTYENFTYKWQTQASETWLKRYFVRDCV